MNFIPRLCKPYRPQTKGKVERMVRYLRDNFYRPLLTKLAASGLNLDKETANYGVRRWLDTIANQRVHHTTQCIPAQQLLSEQALLQKMPTQAMMTPDKDKLEPSFPRYSFDMAPLHHDFMVYEQIITGER